MAGYEQLTPDQIMTIMYIVLTCVIILFFSRVIPSILERNTVKYIEVRVKKELSIEPKSSLFTSIMEWWKARKERKKEEIALKPFN